MTMRRLLWLAGVAGTATGCALGPRYHAMPAVPETTRLGVETISDSTRLFFDSLAAAREADTVRVARPESFAVRPAGADSIVQVSWLEVLKDPALESLVGTSLHNNRDLAAARARISEYRALRGVARAPLLPALTVNASTSKNQIALGAFPPVSYDAYRITGDVAWELDFWGRTRRGIEAAGADLDAQVAAERARVLTLVSDVATGYLQLLELDQEQQIAERTLSSRRTTLDLARQRFAQGLISELDVRQFEAQVTVPAVRLAQVEQQLAVQEHALAVLAGEPPSTIARGTSLAAAARAVTIPDTLPASLLMRRPDVEQAERSFAAATARIGVADAARMPTVSITGSWGTQSGNTGDLFKDQTRVYQLQAGLSFRLFTGGSLENQSRAARARADQAEASWQQTALVALREASDAMTGVRAARDQVVAQETQASALRRALDLAQLRYSTGVSNYLEVLDAQRSLFDAELALSQAQLRQVTAAVQLYKALGGAWTETQTR